MRKPDVSWIAVDWGTSRLRAWPMTADGQPIELLSSDKGMGQLIPGAFEPVLLEVLDGYLGAEPVLVVCCGMVGARQGWREAPYSNVPCPPVAAEAAVALPSTSGRVNAWVLPGLAQSDPPDVMRGEETQIAGFLSITPGFDGVLCLPGTHTKWVQISAGEVVSFRTFMTGELFDLLSNHSVLRHGLDPANWDETAFQGAVGDAISKPQMLGARLFGLRAGGLLAGLSGAAAIAQLSGLLIGTELAGARPYWLGQNIAVIGDPKLCGLYARALSAQGVEAQEHLGDDMTLAGLRAAQAAIKGS